MADFIPNGMRRLFQDLKQPVKPPAKTPSPAPQTPVTNNPQQFQKNARQALQDQESPSGFNGLKFLGKFTGQEQNNPSFSLLSATSADITNGPRLSDSLTAPQTVNGVNQTAPYKAPSKDSTLDLIDRLAAGDQNAGDQLMNLDPSAFSPEDLLDLSDLIRAGGEIGHCAQEILEGLSVNNPQAAQTFLAAATHLKDTPDLLGPLFKAAENNPRLLQHLLMKTPIPAESLSDYAMPYLNHPAPELRKVGLTVLQHQITSKNNHADKMSHQVLSKFELRNALHDPHGQALIKTAVKHLADKIRLRPQAIDDKDFVAIQSFASRQQNTDEKTYIDGTKLMKIFTNAVEQNIPGAPEALFNAMQTPSTRMNAIHALQNASRDVARSLVPFVQNISLDKTYNPYNLKQAVIDKLEPPISKRNVKRMGEIYQQKLHSAIEKAFKDGPKEHPLKKLADLMYGQQILAKAWEDKNDPMKQLEVLAKAMTLDPSILANELDPWDYDLPRLEKDLKAHLESPKLQAEFEKIRTEAMQEAFGKKAASVDPAELEHYLLDGGFQDYLSLLTPDKREKALQSEIEKLTALDADRGIRVAKYLALQELNEKGPAELVKIDPQLATRSLEASIKHYAAIGGKTLSGLDKVNTIKCAEYILTAVELTQKNPAIPAIPTTATHPGQSAKAGMSLNQALEQVIKTQGVSGSDLTLLKQAMSGSNLKNIVGFATFISMGSKIADFKPEELPSMFADLASVTVTGKPLIDKLAKQDPEKLAKIAKALRTVGFAGNLLSAAGQTIRAVNAINQRDTFTAVLATTQGVGDIMGGVGGLMLAGGKSGAVPLLIAGSALSLGGFLIEKLFGNTPEEAFLNELGYRK
jgi:hypothetical protein